MEENETCDYKDCKEKGFIICEDCGKWLCKKHCNRDKHDCDDSVKGCHGIWRDNGMR